MSELVTILHLCYNQRNSFPELYLMRLNDDMIVKALKGGEISIDPTPDESLISGVSVDLHLGGEFRVFEAYYAPSIDLSGSREEIGNVINQVMSDTIKPGPGELFVLQPGEFALGATSESVTLSPDIVGWLDGRSSLARLGLMVHATAHRIDPGWSGNIVLEFYNAGKMPLGLKAGMVICAINFEKLPYAALKPYNKRKDAKYQSQQGAVASRISEDSGK